MTMQPMKPQRTHLAAGGTVVALGALAAAALSAASDAPEKPKPTVAAPVQVRTVVEHRTIKEVRHVKAKAAPRVETPRTVRAMQIDFNAALDKWPTCAAFLRDTFTTAD